MAISFDPRASSSPRASVQTHDIVRPTPLGLVSSPSVLETSPSASSSDGCCGWITKIWEWIKSWFTSAQPAASVFTLEQRMARGKELINEVFRNIPECNPRSTVAVCALRYNNEPQVVYYFATQLERLLNESNRAVEDLLRRNEHDSRGTLHVQSFFWEKLPDGAFNTMSRTRELNFADDQGKARRAASMNENIPIDPIIGEIQRIYNPNQDEGLAFTLRNL